ncbi:MAG: hypothetical protein H8E15_16470 [Planctomycetes bacterium]|nr:hypothetical protein [Planctomycetota bacterium]
MKQILAVIIAYAVWTVIWLGGNAVFFAEAAKLVEAGEAITETGTLLAILGLSVVCSVCAGVVIRKMAAGQRKLTIILSVLLVGTGMAVQASVCDLMPIWYHLSFLILIAPVVILAAGKAK